jgi:hypothetical protein
VAVSVNESTFICMAGKLPVIRRESSRCREDHRARSFVRKRLPWCIHVCSLALPCSYHRRRASASRGLMSSFTTARVAMTATPYTRLTIASPFTNPSPWPSPPATLAAPNRRARHALTAEAHLHLHLTVLLLSTTTITIRSRLELRIP